LSHFFSLSLHDALPISSFVVYRITQIIYSPIFRFMLGVIVFLSLLWTIFFYSHLSKWGENPNSIWYYHFNNNDTYNCYRGNEFIDRKSTRLNSSHDQIS